MTNDREKLGHRLYAGTFLHCDSQTSIERRESTVIGVDDVGTIKFIETIPANKDDDESIISASKQRHGDAWGDAKLLRSGSQGRFFFPGFIDTHIHASQVPNAGVFGDSDLLDWLERYTYPVESSLADPKKAEAVYQYVVQETLSHGTTTASYYAVINPQSTNILSDICLGKGQRAFIGRCNMDTDVSPEFYRDKSVEQAMADTQTTIEHIDQIDPDGRLLKPILTPRFAPSCSAELMKKLGQLSEKRSLPIQTHISENKRENDLVKKMFPDFDSYAAVYEKYGLLNSRTVLAHACHLSSEEIKLVKKQDSKISHCPTSNTSLASGMCPVRDFLDNGVTVGLGTDVSGGYSLSILHAAREASGISRLRAATAPSEVSHDDQEHMKLSVNECLYLATRGGAKCLGLEQKVGGFEIGMQWDAQLIDLGGVNDESHVEPKGGVAVWWKWDWNLALAKWLFTGDQRNVQGVWVDGKLVHGQGE